MAACFINAFGGGRYVNISKNKFAKKNAKTVKTISQNLGITVNKGSLDIKKETLDLDINITYMF